MTGSELKREIAAGARFVVYQYCFSIIVLTSRRGSDVYFIPAGESAIQPGLPYTFLTLMLGWWGIPWGPIYSIGAIYNNSRGGKDVTAQVLKALI